MHENDRKKQLSEAKLAANRRNAQHSRGPKTEAGKDRSAQNSYVHGFFATRLYPNQALVDYDWNDYQRVLTGYLNHYAPVGDVEKLLVEKIAVQSLRLSRLLAHEQRVLGWSSPFESRSIERTMRYETSVSRQLEKATAQLERLQERRRAEEFETPEIQAHDAADETPKANPASKASLTPIPRAESEVEPKAAHTEGVLSNKSSETGASNPPGSESGHAEAVHQISKTPELATEAEPSNQSSQPAAANAQAGENGLSTSGTQGTDDVDLNSLDDDQIEEICGLPKQLNKGGPEPTLRAA
jgi:hypothetical protein